jgi:hypothetical protein
MVTCRTVPAGNTGGGLRPGPRGILSRLADVIPGEEHADGVVDLLHVRRRPPAVTAAFDRIELVGGTGCAEQLLQLRRLVGRHDGIGGAVDDHDRWQSLPHVGRRRDALRDRRAVHRAAEVLAALGVARDSVLDELRALVLPPTVH